MKNSKPIFNRVLGLVLGLVFCTAVAQAQERTLTGTVSDELGGLPGVTVMVVGTTTGTTTLLDGTYNLTYDFKEDSEVEFKYLGYTTQVIMVGTQSRVDVTMVDDLIQLKGTVVTGFVVEDEEDITGSVSVVSAEAMEDRPATRIGDLLTGQAAGVQVVNPGGKPSQGLNIRIRGANSINSGGDPLYIVDGVPTTDTRSINPQDIESISILKDASSAAIYGAQAANGVVIITTKKGKSEGAEFNYSTYAGVSQVWKTLDVLDADQYRELMEDLNYSTDWDLYTANTNWQDQVFQNGTSQNHMLSISGKGGSTSYYMSGGWTEQVGSVRSAEMNRTNFKINLENRARDWLKIGTNTAFTSYTDVDVNDNRAVNQGGVLLGALVTPSIIDIYNEDGTFTSNPFQDWENPLANTDGSQRLYSSQRLIGNVYAEITLLEDFTFKSSAGIDNAHGVYDYFLDPYLTSYGRALNGRAENLTNKSSFYNLDNILKYNKAFDKSTLEVLGGSVIQKFKWENNGIARQGFSSNTITTPNAAATTQWASGDKSEKANMSFISRVHYEWDDKYLLTSNFRADGSSAFGPDNRWGYFPSASAGWRISEEAFMDSVDFVSDLKIRVGWGVVGNDQLNASNYAYSGLVGSGANYPIGGVAQPGTYPATIPNHALRWEETQSTNIGVDAEFIEGRLGATIDVYHKKTSGMLLNAPLPRTTGFNDAVQNIGELENKGLEIALNSVNFESDSGFNWTSNFNISFNRNKVLNILGDEIYDGNVAGRGDVALVREGEPLGTLYGYIWGGVDPQTGLAYYIDQEGESVSRPEADDRVIIGNANPDFMFGLSNNLSYKGFNLTIFLQGAYGQEIFNATRLQMEAMIDPKNQSTAVLDRWQESGDVTDIPRAFPTPWNSLASTRFVEDASYVRVKSVVLSYDFKKEWLSKAFIKGLRVYVSADNLLTFTNYSGFDPEVSFAGANARAQGIDFGTYPQPRTIIGGLNLTF